MRKAGRSANLSTGLLTGAARDRYVGALGSPLHPGKGGKKTNMKKEQLIKESGDLEAEASVPIPVVDGHGD